MMDWDKRYTDNDIPWDKGYFFPSLPFMVEKFPEVFSPKSRAFVPGCGLGHDAVFLQHQELITVGADISATAIEQAKLRSRKVIWQTMDLFFPLPQNMHWAFDVVWEHTCFCAIPVEKRPDYVNVMSQLLAPGKHLAGVFFIKTGVPIEDGPPFFCSREEVIELFSPLFTLAWEGEPPESYEGREGKELLMLWQRK